MHRLFVAIQPPRAVRAALIARMGRVIGARWQTDDQLHLTLRFIGEIDRHGAEDVAVALGGVRCPPLAVTLAGIGQFARRGRIDALWIGAGPTAPLAALHKRIDQALVRAGRAPEGRAYLPHVTLARFGREAGEPGEFIAAAGGTIGPFDVTAFCLYESRLGHDGAAYEMVERYPLG